VPGSAEQLTLTAARRGAGLAVDELGQHLRAHAALAKSSTVASAAASSRAVSKSRRMTGLGGSTAGARRPARRAALVLPAQALQLQRPADHLQDALGLEGLVRKSAAPLRMAHRGLDGP